MNVTATGVSGTFAYRRFRRWPHLSWVCALSPGVMLLVYLTLAIHIRTGLGHWPVPMFEVYDTPAFDVHQLVLHGCLFFAVYAAIPLWLLCLLIRPLRPAWPRPFVPQVSVFVLDWVLTIAVLKFDPTTFSTWWLD